VYDKTYQIPEIMGKRYAVMQKKENMFNLGKTNMKENVLNVVVKISEVKKEFLTHGLIQV